MDGSSDPNQANLKAKLKELEACQEGLKEWSIINIKTYEIRDMSECHLGHFG